MSNPAEDLIGFVRTNQVGCAFAMGIARNPDHEGLHPLIIRAEVGDEKLGTSVGILVEGQPKIAVAIFPAVEDTEQLVALIKQLANLDSWRVEIRDVGDDSYLGVGLRWTMPDGDHESWALGFAPFEHMPLTRRARHVAIVLKADLGEQPFLKRDPSEVSGLRGIHLADLPYGGSVTEYAATWRSSVSLRQRALDGFLEKGGKAKVTFTLPVEYRSQLESLQS